MGLGSYFEHDQCKEIDHSTIDVGYLPPTMEVEQLINLFSSFGKIVETKIMRDHMNCSSRGDCFVKFSNIHYAAQATADMNGYRLEGNTLAVR
jgi:splicing factor 1